jgi:hypothetical protein
VVIDDPLSSLDDHRILATTQELRRLGQRVAQLVILSHSKPFLCRLWEGMDRQARTALKIERDGTGSTLCVWSVDADSITEHDRRHILLTEYLTNGPRGTSARWPDHCVRMWKHTFVWPVRNISHLGRCLAHSMLSA